MPLDFAHRVVLQFDKVLVPIFRGVQIKISEGLPRELARYENNRVLSAALPPEPQFT
jgi:hypothetical protein